MKFLIPLLCLCLFSCKSDEKDNKKYWEFNGITYGKIYNGGRVLLIYVKDFEKYKTEEILSFSYCLVKEADASTLEIHSKYFYITALGTTSTRGDKLLFRCNFKQVDIAPEPDIYETALIISSVQKNKNGKMTKIDLNQFEPFYQCD